MKCGIVEEDVLVIIRIYEACESTPGYRELTVLTRHLTMLWLWHSRVLYDTFGKRAVLFHNNTMDISRCEKGKKNIAGALTAIMIPLDEVDEMLIAIPSR